ncbi:MAG: hypothetical protein M1829_005658 [Trizodia sp. TS-e1964]|nr:MAG: hypothetical protein M1829_005658 [Trizodia sp. TS-e1964]
MADEEKKTTKRSRFDQIEPPRGRRGSNDDNKRSSRFDRRSRSPQTRDSKLRRSRSPPSRGTRDSPALDEIKKPVVDPAAAAAAAAAKINAQLQAKRGIQHVDVPPIRSTLSSAGKDSLPISNVNGEMYIDDGDYIRDIEVNDLRNRYTLTKGATQKMIKDETGADVTTRGEYYPDKSMATTAKPPLYLHLTSTSKEGLEKAVLKIEELMKQELPNLVDERRFRRREPEAVERDEYGRRKWPEERILVELEPIQGFNLRAQVVGQSGAYVKHIQQETRCRVQIKGRGSGFQEPATQRESDEQMYLHVTGPDPGDVQKAKELCIDLLNNVKDQYEKFKANTHSFSYSNNSSSYGQSRPQDRSGYNVYGAGYGNTSTTETPAAAGTSGQPYSAGSTAQDYAAQYAQYYGGQDPYAAYGGYANYAAAYYSYYGQQGTQQTAPGAPPPPPNDVPPPPPSEPQAPPPPGAPSRAAGGYNAVCRLN